MTPVSSGPPTPFQIDVPQPDLDDLQLRLRRARPPNANLDIAWQRGTNPEYMRELTSTGGRASTGAARRPVERAAPVQGARGRDRPHFVHVRGRGAGRMPLLLLHGWPDSFLRYHKVIPTPVQRAQLGSGSFDLVVPSLPGFPFTGAVPRPQASADAAERAAAVAAHDRCARLHAVRRGGRRRWKRAGADPGHRSSRSGIGIHLTDLGWHVYGVDPSSLSKPSESTWRRAKKLFLADGAYAMVQTTRPRSLAAALNDSPVGLASWIVDRFHSWSDSGDLETSFSRDDLLTNIMLYWVTQTIGSSMYNYYAEMRSPSLTPADRVERPVGLALFPRDIGGIPPRTFAERTLNVQRWTEMPRGGHFAALEVPELVRPGRVRVLRTAKRR